jgi:hypothetical protein
MIEPGVLDSALMALVRAIASGDAAAVTLRSLAASPALAGACFGEGPFEPARRISAGRVSRSKTA